MQKIILMFSVVLLFAACKKDDNNNAQQQIQTNVQAGTWRITKFVESGNDETTNYNGYSFTFQSTGMLNAVKNGNSINGSWSITSSNSSSNSSNDLDFNILFAQPDVLTDLNDDWDIISHSANQIELIDISGGNGGTDYLTFVKN